LIFPIEDGLIAVSVRDGSNCLSPDITTVAAADMRMTRFLSTLGTQNEAQALMLRIKDWQDADQQADAAEDGTYLGANPPYRTADSPMTVVSELRAVQGLTPEIYALISPYMCIKPGVEQQININTLTEFELPILAATLGKDLGFAASLLAQRPSGGWEKAAFEALPEFENDEDDAANNFDLISYEPTVLRVNLRVEYRGAVRHSQLMVSPDSNPSVLHRLRGEEAVLPRMPTEDTENEDDET
jgi:general secretion pathway protein K